MSYRRSGSISGATIHFESLTRRKRLTPRPLSVVWRGVLLPLSNVVSLLTLTIRAITGRSINLKCGATQHIDWRQSWVYAVRTGVLQRDVLLSASANRRRIGMTPDELVAMSAYRKLKVARRGLRLGLLRRVVRSRAVRFFAALYKGVRRLLNRPEREATQQQVGHFPE